jgi:nucleoside-diphosphate-sugar epimerase
MKKVLVTGATGFIGNYVIKELLLRDCMVIATSSNETKAKKAEWYPQVKYIPFNLKEFNDTVNYYSFFQEPDLLIHLAWEGLPNYKAASHVEENVPRHLAFLKNIISNGLKDMLVTGTCFEYGMKEGCLEEDIETEPANSYAAAKDQLRHELEVLAIENQIHFKWVRLFYMYGKGQSVNSLFSQLDKALANEEPVFNMSGGEQERDYLPVEEVAVNIVTISLQNKVEGIINCCSGKPIAVKDLVQQYLAEKKATIKLNLGFYPYTDYEPMKFWGDNNKLKSITSNDQMSINRK